MSTFDTLPSTYGVSSATAGTGATTKNDAVSEDRFLKLLVAQMKNQDPMNPLDNAQVTSQMAQISTVGGVEKLNTTVAGLNAQFVQMQALQGATLVDREVTVPGDRLAIASGVGEAGFELAATAGRVKVEVLSPAGQVVETLELGALSAGSHGFQWKAPGIADGAAYRFRVTATQGTQAIASTALMRDRVDSVSTTGTGLQLNLQHSGSITYDKVRAFN